MRKITRRQAIISLAGTATLAGAAAAEAFGPSAERLTTGMMFMASSTITSVPSSSGAGNWSNPATWNLGRVPTASDVVEIAASTTVTLDVDASVAGLTVDASGTFLFDPHASRSFISTGNVVVSGVLQMQPMSPAIVHQMTFSGIDETRFVGGGMMPLDSDVGLWVIGAGKLVANGAAKRAWCHLTAPATPGASSITVEDATGWQVGDVLAIAPTITATNADTNPSNGNWPMHTNTAYDFALVKAVSGTTVTLDRTLTWAHPAITLVDGSVHYAEVLNLTRNVRIAGTPSGYTHTFFHSTVAQAINYVALQFVGPRGLAPSVRQDTSGRTGYGAYPNEAGGAVLGRYGIHYHMMENATNGEVSTGVLVQNCGSHGIVSHDSYGVTWRDTIVDFCADSAYWWDNPQQGPPAPTNPFSNNVTYDRCLASRVTAGHENGAFDASCGSGNAMVNGCTAVGGLGNGMIWQSSSGVWSVQGFVSHNNSGDGLFSWTQHIAQEVDGAYLFNNGGFGIDHGAYDNAFHYVNCVVAKNVRGPVTLLAVSAGPPDGDITLQGCKLDASGEAAYCVTFAGAEVAPGGPTYITGCSMTGYTVAPLGPTNGVPVQVS